MELVRQPSKSNLCGQACLAMLINVTLQEAINLCGKKGKTSRKDLAPVLRAQYRVGVTKRMGRYSLLDGRLLITLKWISGRSHWIVMDEGIVYDPVLDEPLSYDSYLHRIQPKGRITSYIKLQ